MNKLQAATATLLTLGGLSQISNAGEEVIIIEPVSYAVLPAQECPWWMEATGFYGFSQNKLFKASSAAQAGHVDLIGGDLTLGRNFGKSASGGVNSLDLRFGYGYGSNAHHEDFTDIGGDIYKEKARVNNFYLMPGYRYSMNVNDSWSFFVGVHAGVDNMSIKSDMDLGMEQLHAHKSAWGFAYSAELGMKYHMTKDWYWQMAYEFRGSTASPKLVYDGESMETRKQMYHTVRLGLGWNF